LLLKSRVIHEFDPWFNFRATEYLVEHGSEKFFSWYDEKSWYPLGRPIGTTIYPGLQFTAASLWAGARAVWGGPGGYFEGLTLNDVCVFIPAIFGVIATAFTGLLAYEVVNCLV
jgi:dolichyl-diphosphooligosaccharide--protein glycosyltransferase